MVGTRFAIGRRVAFCWMCALLWPFSVIAAEVRLALQPLVVVDGDDGDAAAFEAEVLKALERRKVSVVRSEEVAIAMGSDPSACGEDASCVAQAALRVDATHVLQITVAPYAPRVMATAKLVGRDGRIGGAPRVVEIEPRSGARRTIAHQAIRSALEGLRWEALEIPPAAQQRAEAEVARETETSRPPEPGVAGVSGLEEPDRRAGDVSVGVGSTRMMRIASYAALGVGTAGALGGMGLGFLAQGSASELDRRLVDGKLREGDTTARALFVRSETQRGQAVIAGVVGGALLATGAVLYLFSAPADVPQVTVEISERSVGISVVGGF